MSSTIQNSCEADGFGTQKVISRICKHENKKTAMIGTHQTLPTLAKQNRPTDKPVDRHT